MGRSTRQLHSDFCYHITTRCNNREFKLIRHECRQVFIYALNRVKAKFGFTLFGLCIMSNHVHYLLEPAQPEDLPRIMHWLNWFTAMCFNRMLNRTGHFWEERYYASGFPSSDYRRVLNTLRYIHANPKAAQMQAGYFYDFSNYGIHDRLTDDGLTQWHPAFLSLGNSLDSCAKRYRKFCEKYKPKPKPKSERRYGWGSRLLPKILKRKDRKRHSPGQIRLPWGEISLGVNPEIQEVAKQFVRANALNPEVALQFFDDS